VSQARLRPRAETDLLERTRYYRSNAGDDVAARFFDAAIASLRAAARMPGSRSPRVGELCDIPGLRVQGITGYPCGWFYIVHQDHIDVVRLLADTQDLNAALDSLDD
jgi:toxin ParE1/3/4